MSAVVHCEHCGQMFEVAATLVGGITNCPECGKATQVTGLRDPLWRILQIGGVALVIAIACVLYVTSGLPAAITSVGVGATALWLISRAF